MPRSYTKLHALKRPKFRQSWNKYNLYNLTRIKSPIAGNQSYFKQKWYSKSLTRTYHGSTIKEKQWQRTFNPTMRSVVRMDPGYMASHDGSDEASGRGSGPDQFRGAKPRQTPYMNMLFAPLERRLDTAIFRAMFASSILQARQFCVHGYVKVNGQKMVHSAYNLNPGDMFQVDPERVMLATGMLKSGRERRQERRFLRREQIFASRAEKEESETSPTETVAGDPSDSSTTPRATLQSLLSQAKTILAEPSTIPSAARKRELRAFQREVRRALSNKKALEASSIDSSLATLAESLNLDSAGPSPDNATSSSRRQPERRPSDAPPPKTRTLQTQEEKMLAAALQEARDNPIDPSKPYVTPWRPRPYMSAFAFIPRYLEVHHAVCSAVYLRHPVARAGMAEVPTPFPGEVNGLAFNWYLRRR